MKRLSIREIKPLGWLEAQLIQQKNGLGGHIDEIWYDTSEKSAWLGGDGEAWERGPYYLDGLIPLAYVLDDGELKTKVEKWVSRILESQKEDGSFGPIRSKDWWSRTIVLKALITYHEATEDERILPFMKKYFHYQMKEMVVRPFFMWAQARALEEIIPIKYYMDKTGDSSVSKLVAMVKEASFDWFEFFSNIPFKKSTRKYLSKALINVGRKVGIKPDMAKKYGNTPLKEMPKWKVDLTNRLYFMKKLMFTHGVNVAMALKYPALYQLFDGKDYNELVKKGYKQLMECHGTAIGLHTSNEHLDGPYAHRGTELCTVAEAMFSFSHLLEITKDSFYADLLELVAYNAYPATFTADMKAHQYLQQVNQISSTIKKRDFYDVNNDANIFGLEPNFGCCAANMHQGWPRFVSNLAFKERNSIYFMVYAPSEICTDIGGEKVIIRQETNYPFHNRSEITIVKAPEKEITLFFRVPKYTSLTVGFNSHGILRADNGIIELKRKFKDGDKIQLIFNSPLTVTKNPGGSVSVRRGSLLLGVKLNTEEIDYGKIEKPYHYRGYSTKDEWNFTPLIEGEEDVRELPLNMEMPFDEKTPPLEVEVNAVRVRNFKEIKGSAVLPSAPDIDKNDIRKITLVPYGCTRLRIAEFPDIHKK